MSISFDFDEEAFMANIQLAVIETAKESIRIKVSGVVCPVHHETPMIEFDAESPDSLHAQIRGCCDESVRMAETLLNSGDDLLDEGPVGQDLSDSSTD